MIALPTIDVHTHLAGTGCCGSGAWVSPQFQRRHTFRLLRFINRISHKQLHTTIDHDWATKLSQTIKASDVDYGVALGFDGVYAHGARDHDVSRSQMIIPQKWVFKVAHEQKNILPGPSINPHRADALDQLREAIDEGAVLVKWLPATQAIDPGDSRLREFYRLLADARVPLLVHMGGERTFAEVTPEMNDVTKLELPLIEGVRVICAHSATRVIGSREPDQQPALRRLLKQYPNLWLDNSGMCNPARFAHVPLLARDPFINERTLYGSDWPVPVSSLYFVGKMSPLQILRFERIKNPMSRDIAIKNYFGYGKETLTRAHRVLGNLSRWMTPSPSR